MKWHKTLLCRCKYCSKIISKPFVWVCYFQTVNIVNECFWQIIWVQSEICKLATTCASLDDSLKSLFLLCPDIFSVENSVDPDQMVLTKPSDQDSHCFPLWLKCWRLTGVKMYIKLFSKTRVNYHNGEELSLPDWTYEVNSLETSGISENFVTIYFHETSRRRNKTFAKWGVNVYIFIIILDFFFRKSNCLQVGKQSRAWRNNACTSCKNISLGIYSLLNEWCTRCLFENR